MPPLFNQEIIIRLKNQLCVIKPASMNIENYIITEVTANMAGYNATDVCLNRVRQLCSQRPFVAPAQRVEIYTFPTSATLTGIRTSQIIPLSHVTVILRITVKREQFRPFIRSY
ncbi:MAG: hypothetical protein EZS28_042252 [Streblomastix strix]|uniref:Uncharacterized protein n=1 Tax=Streblomastix strix TaxID=222440 RepID=A0A5J4TX67_9EUKA|nr:MAG: hypothetical protein EZS28_042252 [Streblomastix strix]